MIRLPILLAALCQLPSAQPPAVPTNGRFEAAAYGVSSASADNGPALQWALDAAAAYSTAYSKANPGYFTRATVHVPAAPKPYTLATGVSIDASGVELVGDGPGSKLVAAQMTGGPLVTIGIARPPSTPWGVVRPDLFGKLDKVAVPKPGKLRGFRSNGTESLMAFGNVLTHGGTSTKLQLPYTDLWQETDGLTIDIALEGPAGALPVGCYIGSGVMGRWAAPWAFTTTATGATFLLSTQGKPFAAPVSTPYAIPFAGPGVHRVSVQVDVSAPTGPTVAAWVDGLQVAAKPASAPPTGPVRLHGGGTYCPFLIGQVPGALEPPLGKVLPDFTLDALCLSRSLRYKVGAVGSVQARADSVPINDLWRYFPTYGGSPSTTDANALAFLPGDDDPTIISRRLPVMGGMAGWNVRSVAFILDAPAAAQMYNAVRNLELVSGSFSGMGVMWTPSVLELSFSDFTSAGGGVYGVACLPRGANYTIRLDRCTLAGTDAGILGYKSIVQMRDTTFPSNGRCAIRGYGCNFDVADVFVTRAGRGQESFAQFFTEDYGGVFTLRHVLIDNEGDGDGYSRAGVYCERHPYAMTTLRMENVDFGAAGVPPIALRDIGPTDGTTWKPALLIASQVAAGGSPCAIEVDGGGWLGGMRDSIVPTGGRPAVTSLGTFGPSAVRFVDFMAPAPSPVVTPAMPTSK